MTYEDLEEDLYESQEWTSLKGKFGKVCFGSLFKHFLASLLDVSKLTKLVNRINLTEDYTTNLSSEMNPKLDKNK